MEQEIEIFNFQSADGLDPFIASSGGSLLQSWSWGDVMVRGSGDVRRLGLRDQSGILAAVTLIKKKLGLGFCYWLAPRGPIFSKRAMNNSEATNQTAARLFDAVRVLDSRALFLRFEPNAEIIVPGMRIKKTIDLEPAETLILDLRLTEEALLLGMHQKTRYNLRLAEKKGVAIREVRQPSSGDWQEFRRLLDITGSRDGFRLHPLKHYENLLAGSGGAVRLFFAAYEGKVIAAGLFSFWRGQASYLHGASDNEFRSAMAPHLLQWTVIRRARAEACLSYDFCGIDEKKWPGVTRFKLGFGGERKKFPGTFDALFHPVLYNLYSVVRKLRRGLA